MTAVSEAWLGYVWTMLWQSTLVMLAVWFLYALLWKRSAALRYALLCLILIKLLLPTSLHSVTGLGHWLGNLDRPPSFPIVSPAPLQTPPDFDYNESLSIRSSGAPDLSPNEAQPIQTSQARIHLPTRLFSVWLAGVLFLATLLFVHALRIRKRFSTATPVSDPVPLALLEDCRVKMGVSKKIPLYQLERLSSPVLAGLFRPRILISRTTLERLGEAHLRPIFLHELAHAKRRDLWVNTLQIVLQVLWFFHPGLWLTNWLLRRERERACDDLVLAHLEGASRDYADSILRVLKESASPRFATVGLLGIAERGASVKGRIRRILDSRRNVRVKIGALGAVSLLVLGAVLLPMAKGESDNTDIQNQQEIKEDSSKVQPSPHSLLEKLPKIRSLTYTSTTRNATGETSTPFPIHFSWTDSGYLRNEFSGATTIFDLNKGKKIFFDSNEKTATIQPHDLRPDSGNLLSLVKNALTGDEEYLGEKLIDGVTAYGFRYRNVKNAMVHGSDAIVTLWLDRKTGAPVWVEMSVDISGGVRNQIMVSVWKDIIINPDLDPSDFSMEIPEGYKVRDQTVSKVSSNPELPEGEPKLLTLAKREKAPSARDLLAKLPEIQSLTYSVDSKLWADGKVHPPWSVLWHASGHVRSTLDGNASNVDLNQGKSVTLNASEEYAIIQSHDFDLEYGNPVSFLGKAIDDTEEYLGAKEVDGVASVGFRCKGVEDKSFAVSDATVTFWLNSETGAPVRIEEAYDLYKRSGELRDTQLQTFTDIVINPDLDLSLFSMGIPEGYKVEDRTKSPNTTRKDDEDQPPAQFSEEPLSATETLAKVEYALLSYRLDFQRFPESLDQLLDPISYINALPPDPHTSDSIIQYFVEDATHCLIYSVGPDGEDNGGDPNKDLVISLGPDSKLPPCDVPKDASREHTENGRGDSDNPAIKRKGWRLAPGF